MQERIEGLRQSVAKVSQRIQAPKTWLGSESINALRVLCDLIDLVDQMNIQIAGHVHASSPPPSNAAAFTGASTNAKLQAAKLKPITL